MTEKQMMGPLLNSQRQIMKTEVMLYLHQDLAPSCHIILEANVIGPRWKEGPMIEK